MTAILINPYAFTPPSPASVSRRNIYNSGTVNPPQSTITFNNVDIGAAASDRTVIIHVGGLPYSDLTDVSIGGVSVGTVVAVQGSSASKSVSALAVRALPSGTTTTVGLSFTSLTSTAQQIIITSFRAVGLQSLTPVDTASVYGTNASSRQVAVDVEQDGIVVAGADINVVTSYSLSGVGNTSYTTTSTYGRTAVGWEDVAATEAARQITASLGGSGGRTCALVAASFR